MLRQDEAEDLFQETWVRVMVQVERFDPDRPLAPRLSRIARNLALDRMRWFKRWRQVAFAVEHKGASSGAVPEPPVPATAEDRLVSRELADKLLASLDARWREVLWLRSWGDLAYEEIAAVCQFPVGTVKSRLARALDRVARQWAELEGRAHAAHELALW